MFKKKRNKSPILFLVIVLFCANSLGPWPMANAQGDFFPQAGGMVHLSPGFVPAQLIGMTVNPRQALKFDFLFNRGETPLNMAEKRQVYGQLIKYFLASLAVHDQEQWVNLSPYEQNRIIGTNFGKTQMGRDLLEQDYLLKQLTASLIYPEKNLGKNFWDTVYSKASQMYGTTQIPVNTFNLKKA